jgi:hypothetical protein
LTITKPSKVYIGLIFGATAKTGSIQRGLITIKIAGLATLVCTAMIWPPFLLAGTSKITESNGETQRRAMIDRACRHRIRAGEVPRCVRTCQ